MPVPAVYRRLASLRSQRPQKLKMLLISIVFVIVLAPLVVKFDPGYLTAKQKDVLMVASVSVITVGGWVLLAITWLRREPLRYHGSVLAAESRPVAYFLCMLFMMVFASAMIYGIVMYIFDKLL